MKIKNHSGLSIDFLENGSVEHIDAGPVRISLRSASVFSVPGTNLYLRKSSNPGEFTALLGGQGQEQFAVTEDSYISKGSWSGIDHECVVQLSKQNLSWQWSVCLTNRTDAAIDLDMIHLQDAGLKTISDGLVNEYYVSQYIERLILEDKDYGKVICCRQNMKEANGHPWLMMACKNTAIAGSTDGMQFYGKTFRQARTPAALWAGNLAGEYAGESSILALQEKPFKLAPGEHHESVFVTAYLPDHPSATSADDLKRLPDVFAEFDIELSADDFREYTIPVENIFSTSSFLPVENLSESELEHFFGNERRHSEFDQTRLLSFFCRQNDHVILLEKEVLTDRPHAHIMQASQGFGPEESIASTTSYAYGVFNSHLSQGNTNFNIFLSVCNSQFNLSLESGQRIFVGINGRKYLLGVPSAFEMGLNHCRWIYKFREYCFQVSTWTSKVSPQVNMDFKVHSGSNVELLITHHFDFLNGWTVCPGIAAGEFIAKPRPGSMITGKFPKAQFRIIVQKSISEYSACGDEALYPDYKRREDSLFVLEIKKTSAFSMSFVAEVTSAAKYVLFEDPVQQYHKDCKDAEDAWQDLSLKISLKSDQQDLAAIREALPWFGMNALTHFLTPFGLEQFSGAAWGTRDIAQGPFDLLLCMEKYDIARKVLCIIFSNQNPDGGWPQWWMFDSYREIRADSSHGDVFYWCIIALSNYIRVTGDTGIMDEMVSYYDSKGLRLAETTALAEHIERLLGLITSSFIRGTALVPFGGGDWNDSLQPVSKELARRMISSWTVEMNYQAFSQLQFVYELTGNDGKARELKEICGRIAADFNQYLIRDGVVAGYGLMEEDGSISLLLHPSDTRTGIHYSLLPMNRGIISGILTEEQGLHHQMLIEEYLKGPDGARLMDRPLKYSGGLQTLFQRAESSTFFGREIGLMYVHEHIRYAEALAITGKADAFVKALRQANPVAYREIVECGDIRQANCYYSSSDVAFKSRYEADERYDEIKTGTITMRGGWRVYSSGPGIYFGIVVARLLGLSLESGKLIIDPVLPKTMDGLSAFVYLMGYPMTFIYMVKEDCYSPKTIFCNDLPIRFIQQENKYRKGGAIIDIESISGLLNRKENMIRIKL